MLQSTLPLTLMQASPPLTHLLSTPLRPFLATGTAVLHVPLPSPAPNAGHLVDFRDEQSSESSATWIRGARNVEAANDDEEGSNLDENKGRGWQLKPLRGAG